MALWGNWLAREPFEVIDLNVPCNLQSYKRALATFAFPWLCFPCLITLAFRYLVEYLHLYIFFFTSFPVASFLLIMTSSMTPLVLFQTLGNSTNIVIVVRSIIILTTGNPIAKATIIADTDWLCTVFEVVALVLVLSIPAELKIQIVQELPMKANEGGLAQ